MALNPKTATGDPSRLRVERAVQRKDLSRVSDLVFYSLADRLSGTPEFKIFVSVVAALAVLVVNVFAAEQLPAESALHDNPMFEVGLSVDADSLVSSVVDMAEPPLGGSRSVNAGAAMLTVVVEAAVPEEFGWAFGAVRDRARTNVAPSLLNHLRAHRPTACLSLVVGIAETEGFRDAAAVGDRTFDAFIRCSSRGINWRGSAPTPVVVQLAHPSQRCSVRASRRLAVHA